MTFVRKFSIIIASLVLLYSCTPQARFVSAGPAHGHSGQRISQAKVKSSRSGNSYKIRKIKGKSAQSKTVNSNEDIKAQNQVLDLRSEIINEAGKWIGTPYCYGGESQSCTDCSGFVMRIYERFGIDLPRTAAAQFDNGDEKSLDNIMIGDLVFFRNKGHISHVGIYAGNDKFIHASSSQGVTITSLNKNYYQQRLAGVRTFL